VVVEGPQAGEAVELTGPAVTIGRAADNSLVLTDDYVSSHHARLTRDGGRWQLEDGGSTNGVLVDGRRIGAAVPLGPDSTFRIGVSTLKVEA
jgi:pSer/pThr/pTyr-binding forkhead associated (FHA) protein